MSSRVRKQPDYGEESGVPNGIRTRVSALKGLNPRPLDDGDAERRMVLPPGCPASRRASRNDPVYAAGLSEHKSNRAGVSRRGGARQLGVSAGDLRLTARNPGGAPRRGRRTAAARDAPGRAYSGPPVRYNRCKPLKRAALSRRLQGSARRAAGSFALADRRKSGLPRRARTSGPRVAGFLLPSGSAPPPRGGRRARPGFGPPHRQRGRQAGRGTRYGPTTTGVHARGRRPCDEFCGGW